MSDPDSDSVGTRSPQGLAEQITHYRDVREVIERGMLPVATSLDGITFELQASLHDLAVRRGGYVVLEDDRASRLGQITDLAGHSDRVGVEDAAGARSDVLVRLAVGSGRVLGGASLPFHDARVRPATSDEVAAWLADTRPDRAGLPVGQLVLARGVTAELDSGGLSRHTFMCGQSGSGKTYSLGLLLENVLAETKLPVVILDPNSDYVGLRHLRPGADPVKAERYRSVTGQIAVWGMGADADRPLRIAFTDLDSRAQGAVLGLDPIRDRDEYAALNELLHASVDGQPLVSGLDQLIDSPSPSARQLGQRAANLGVVDWAVWSRGQASLIRELEHPTSRCTIVDLGSLETMEEQRLVADAVLATLWRLRLRREPVLVVIDEAHNICASDPEHAVSRLTTERTVQIAAEGRKYGLYLLVSTQRPDKVHENVVSQCDNLLLMRMNSSADVAALSSLFSFVPPGLMAGAPSFAMGQALVSGRILPRGAGYVQMGDRVTLEGGADIPLTWARPAVP